MGNTARTHIKHKCSHLLWLIGIQVHEWKHTCPSLSRLTSLSPFADPSNTSTGSQPPSYPCLDPGPSYLLCGSSADQLVQPDTRNHTFTHSSHRYSRTHLTALFIALISPLYYFCYSAWPFLIILKRFLKLHWILNSCIQRRGFWYLCQTEIFSVISSLIPECE